jgi:16S rRNA (cytosine967-C5)-methyltransferase
VKHSGVSPARSLAFSALALAWDPKGPGISDYIEEEATKRRLDPRDRGLARELVLGVLRNRLWLEHELSKHLREPIQGKSARAHDALLLGAYQLLHLDRIPAHAAVSESVELLSGDAKAERFKPLVNAVLRRLAKQAADEALPWAVRESIPQAVLDAVAGALPEEEVEAFAAASNRPAPLCLRVTRLGRMDRGFMRFIEQGILRVEGEAVGFRRGALAGPDCLIVEQAGIHPVGISGFAEGFVTVEDEGAQVAALLAAAGAKGPVLDLCASPGGKTSHLADVLPADAPIMAADLNQAKLDRLEETLTRLKLSTRVEKSLSSKLMAGGHRGAFGTVLVDAPCSGLGTLRRHPEIRYRYGREGREGVVQTQAKLLREAARLVAPGGLLIYSVCTVNRAECEDQIGRFLGETRDFEPDGDIAGGVFEAMGCGPGMWRTWPHRHGCDGFFVARMRKGGG